MSGRILWQYFLTIIIKYNDIGPTPRHQKLSRDRHADRFAATLEDTFVTRHPVSDIGRRSASWPPQVRCLILEVIRSSGLNIFLETLPVRKDSIWDSVTAPGYWFGTLLEGNIAVDQSQLGERTWTSGGTAVFSADEEIHTRHTSLHDGSVSAVFLQVEAPLAEPILGEEASALLSRNRLHREGLFPDLARTIAWQMLACRMTGAARRLFITGKAMEIVAHVINSTIEEKMVGAERHGTWSPRDIECFHEARSILLAELACPPSVTELARRVGTNAKKLGAGFNELFGQPVYAFVKTNRLDAARQMLEAGETSVSNVARYVGYQPQHFATEFRRRFGMSPTQVIGRRT